ncbi:hypothetical protein QQS21_006880 [Conoideocrella luteorostrata]|uniref:SEC7 domain-containing protein n=1 Tax=Conoideocrella luteorostrata TaxID=1105319 RepID=A0AAJ0FSK0_9HYPO|nr:hypothetical protein QQS21_006880 [Conoideocrella luteorostrata]
MLSTLPSPSHFDHSKTTYFGHDPFLPSLASSSRLQGENPLCTPPSVGRSRTLATVPEAPTPEATTPELGSQPLSQSWPVPGVVPVGVAVPEPEPEPEPAAHASAPAPAPASASTPVPSPLIIPVPVPPRGSSASKSRPPPTSSPQGTTAASRATRTAGTAGTAGTSAIKKSHRHHSRQRGSFAQTLPTFSSRHGKASSNLTAPVYATAAAAAQCPLLLASASASTSASASHRRPCLAANDYFLDKPTTAPMDVSMADNRTARTPPRDSHDLALSSRDITRDSLVVNMLLSLDQLSFGQSPTEGSFGDSRGVGSSGYDDDHSSRPWTNHSTASSRGRHDTAKTRHWHQPSFSSDVEAGANDDSYKHSGANPPLRGRRSNSGSNNVSDQFPQLNTMGETSYRNRNQPDTPPRSNHARGGRQSNKSSSSASIDMGYPTSTMSQRLAQRTGRSASFDYGPQQSQLQQLSLSSPFRVDFPETFASADYAAAPTPTVPGGPRREASNRHIPPPPPQPADSHTLERRRSTSRSLKSSTGKNKRGNPHHRGAGQTAQAMPAQELTSAPAPSVGYGKSKELDAGGNSASQAKDRPGFFRRVFGSSKTNTTSNGSLPATQMSTSRLPSSPERTAVHHHQQPPPPPNSTSKSTSVPPSRDTSSSHSLHNPPLQRKSSSFFRRLKKSVADEAPPLPDADQVPPLPSLHSTNVQQQIKDDASAQSVVSPTSSLRKVMNPYLRESATGLGLTGVAISTPLSDITNTPSAKSDSLAEYRTEEYKREFSPDYEPSPNARIRKVNVEAGVEVDAENLENTPSKPPKQVPKKLRHSNSFLDLDAGSENENDGHGAHKKGHRSVSAAGVKDDEDRGSTIRAKKKPMLDLEDGSRQLAQSNLGPRTDGGRSTSFASGSTETGYKTAPSAPPSVLIDENGEPSPKVLGTLESMKSCKPLDEPEFIIGEPTEDDRQKAQRIYDGGEEFIQKDKAAAWMGEQGPVRQRTLQAYMELYDFRDQSILSSLRQVCGRLLLRAETQQVDRILVAFSRRWCNCNPQHGFKATDVIHMICYSIILLNTDLHLADIEQKMTRSQFIKNTMTTITQAVAESAPAAFTRPSILPEKNSMLHVDPTPPTTQNVRSNRNSFRPPPRSDTNSSDLDDCGPLVKSPFHGPMRAWEEQVELVLKYIYASIREERLPLFGAEHGRHVTPAQSQSSLSVLGMLKRSPSVLSKAPSETQLSSRGRVADSSRTSASRWTSKSRSRPGLGRTGFSSSRTSFDDGNSMWSPAMSSATWSKHSLGRTQGSMSQDSFASSMRRGDYQQSVGFANALSQAIIRDEDVNGQENAPSILSADLSTHFLEDESLELAGPPWVKEGMVMHKHHLDGYGKRAKDRNWTEVFAVVQKGQMGLFSFNASKSMRQKSRSRNAGRPLGPVGGGNWQDNAVNLGTFNLRLTLASALPPPGYSRSRPHVWALSLPTGAVHLFQVGTPEIIREFVHTANYWSARLSTHPLVGGISNIEYGWSDAIVNNALVSAINESATSVSSGGRNSRPGSSAAHVRKSSAASGSFRGSSFDQVSGAFTNNSGRGKLPGDRIHIAEWTPPTQSMRPSNASETDQLQTLVAYVRSIEEELQSHNQMRSPMLLAFTPRGQNAGKAMANWERKSAYLLREIVKFRTYVDCLQQAEARKREIYSERDLAQKAARGDLSDGDMEVSEEEDADETLRP